MKIGKLRVYRVCGCWDFVLGPKPIVGPLCTFVLLALFTFVLSMMALAIPPSVGRAIAFVGIGLNAAMFIHLSFSNPGLPSQIRHF